MHVHVSGSEGEAKFWIEPVVALADHTGLSARDLLRIQTIVVEHYDEIKKAWKKHFAG